MSIHRMRETGSDEIKDTWFRACVKGNLLMPQTYVGGAIFLAQAVVASNGLEELKTSGHLNTAQLKYLRRAMEASHRLRRIPAGNRAFLDQARQSGRYDMSRSIMIDDDKLQYTWNRFQEHAVAVIDNFTQGSDGFSTICSIASILNSKECKGLLRQFRLQYDRRHQCSDEAAAMLRLKIFICIDKKCDLNPYRSFVRTLFVC